MQAPVTRPGSVGPEPHRRPHSALADPLGRPVKRVELPPPPGPPRFRIAASATDSPEWRTTADVRQLYHLGRKAFTGVVQEPTAPDPLPSGR